MSTVAVVGATGAVGREILNVLEQRRFDVGELRLLASPRSAGRAIHAFGADHEVIPAAPEAFSGVDVAFFSAGSAISRVLVPAARSAGAFVVDNSSAFRMEPDCPLVVPELNGETLEGHGGIIANPNCSAILLCMAVAPIHRAVGIARLVVSTYQAVSGAGAQAMEEMRLQEEADREGRTPEYDLFPTVIAHNVIPWVQAIDDDGYSTEETKLRDETCRILGADLTLSATCVRVPVWRAHSQAVHMELCGPLAPGEAIEAYRDAPGVIAREDALPTPRDVSLTDEVFVGRVRADRAFAPGLALWCVMDQLRKGAALNAVQIVEQALGS